jgi:hypothetical protein
MTRNRLQIATRIHYLLLREIGQGIDIERMLKQPRYERDVLLVCDACPGTELATLAQQYREAGMPPAAGVNVRRGGHAPQATGWSGSTTGFGITRPLEAADTAASEIEPDKPGPKRPPKRNWISRWWQR